MLDKFAKKLNKLENYHILYEDLNEGYLIVTTKINLMVKISYDKAVFQPYSFEKPLTLNVSFVIASNDKFAKFREFRRNEIPIVVFPTSVLGGKLENISNELNKFIDIKFKK
jgi:hypothetical protein